MASQPEQGQDLEHAEKRARQLLGWSAFVSTIALAVLALDVMIKRQLLEVSRDAHETLDRVRRPGPVAGTGASSPYPGVASMGSHPAPSADPDQDAGSADD